MTSPTASRDKEIDSSRKGAAVPVALCVAAVLLALPEALLARHDFGPLSTTITLVSDVAAICAGVLLGIGVASAVLGTRLQSRRTIGILVIVSLVVGFAVLVLANVAPPPLSTTPFLTGPITANGVLNAVYVVGTLGSGAAALRLTVAYVLR